MTSEKFLPLQCNKCKKWEGKNTWKRRKHFSIKKKRRGKWNPKACSWVQHLVTSFVKYLRWSRLCLWAVAGSEKAPEEEQCLCITFRALSTTASANWCFQTIGYIFSSIGILLRQLPWKPTSVCFPAVSTSEIHSSSFTLVTKIAWESAYFQRWVK